MKKMAKKSIWLGILAIVLVFGMAVVACAGAEAEEDDFITISGIPKVGEKLTATSSKNYVGDFSWIITHNHGALYSIVGINIDGFASGINNSELTIPATYGSIAVGYFIHVSRRSQEGGERRSAVGPIQAAE
jgi:hypothetical protein